jgi:hypothetical protein
MKKIKLLLAVLIAGFTFVACGINDTNYEYDYTAPNIPNGVQVLNGDGRVDISWNHNRESDLAGYNVYYSYTYEGRYTLIGTTQNNYFVDYEVTNGTRYYYAVTAFDYNNNESELSLEVVYARPRPEGFNQSIFDFRRFPNNSGYSFTTYSVVPYDDLETDFYFEIFQGNSYLVVYDDTDIIDMGPTNDIWDIDFAPETGWSPYKDEIAKVGHTYVIWTYDNHFAKVRIKSMTSDRIVFDWAFQTAAGDPQLKPVLKGGTRDMKVKERSIE